ncbi:receptor activity-modifying protein 3 isoform X2 [Melospiza melodia melodia]|uniref:receptor activity-modifying protein 3 isoform X2 n=1 Tax=Melospiza melodia melodia TaxID=1914991 RepID=UPI002FD5DEB1
MIAEQQFPSETLVLLAFVNCMSGQFLHSYVPGISETSSSAGRQLFVNGLMTLGFAGARQQSELCNESLMLEKLPACGKSFEEMMKRVDSKKWCNLTEFIMYYDNFTQCTEREANNASCFWPNPLAEGFITGIHKQFFSNCTSEKVHWEDPPDEILITLILIPVLLTCAMITLVVWCSKRSDILV